MEKRYKVLKTAMTLLALLVMALGLPPGAVDRCSAQTPSLPSVAKPAAEAVWSAETAQQMAAKADTELKAALRSQTPDNASRLGIDMETMRGRIQQWVALKATYEDIAAEIQQAADVSKEAEAVREELNAFKQRGLLQQPPYSLDLYDDILDEKEAVQQALGISDSALAAARRNLEDFQSRLDTARQQLRSFTDNTAKGQMTADAWQRESVELEVKLSDAVLRLQQHRQNVLHLERQVLTERMALIEAQLGWLQGRIVFRPQDLARHVDQLETKKKELQQWLSDMREKKKIVDQKWLNARASAQSEVYAVEEAQVRARLKGLDAWRKTYQAGIDQTADMVRLTDQQAQAWKHRHDLLNAEVPRDRLLQLRKQADGHIDQLGRILAVEQQRHNTMWQQISAADEDHAPSPPTAGPDKDSNPVKALKAMAAERSDYIGMLTMNLRLEQRLRDQIDARLERRPIRYNTEKLWAKVRGIWNYEVWVIDNRPLTVKKIVVALIILIAGITAARMLVGRLTRRLLYRLQIKTTTAATLDKLLHYAAYLMVVLFALRMINIPLAAFAFLGGAIAIGIGFGAQNLINNFISGFIIMGEQPISIGDLIEVEGVLGQVEEIGARCTQIRTGENIHILVPNSSFLEKNITNWTLSDRIIRAHVTVGVIYGSPVDQVQTLLLQACRQIKAVRESPEPFVLFTDFGDNALMFEVHFWISVQRIIERRLIESSLRVLVDELFRQADIVIAFPQRDVHLDSPAPLKIQMIPADRTDPQDHAA